MYGNKFLDMWRDADIVTVKKLWAEEMSKLSNEELKRGFTALMQQDWPPSLPTYIKLCKPSVDPLVAYYEAIAGLQARQKGEVGTWSHPAIFHAAKGLQFDLLNLTYSQMKTRWERAFSEEMEKGEWPAIPVPMVALPAPGKTELSRDAATKMLNELGAQGVIKPAQSKTDHRLWAKRIIERSKKNDHGLNALQIRFAKEALAEKAVQA